MRKLLSITIICSMMIAMFSGCGLLQKLGLQEDINDELRPVSSIAMNEDEAKKLTDKVPIHLYFANEDNTKLKLEIRYIPLSEAKKSVNNRASLIVKELINGPDSKSGLKATIPAGTKQGARIKIDAAKGIATVDFSKEFIDKHPGGKIAEQLTIYSIVNSLTELKEIQKVRFTIAGKVLKEYKGSYQFDAPFPRAAVLISKDVSATPSPTLSPTASPAAKDKEKTKDTNGDIIDEEDNIIDTLNASDIDALDPNGEFME
jgi:germination protein M